MNDPIDRQAAIDTLGKIPVREFKKTDGLLDALVSIGQVYMALKQLPPVQPERLTDDDFETIRIHLNAYKEKLCNQHRWKEAEEYQRILDRFMAFASAQPDIDEWCHDCKEYDKERHCCPRWNRVIRQTLKDAQPEIIHCGECRHFATKGNIERVEFGKCSVIKSVCLCEDYCSWAERKEGEGDADALRNVSRGTVGVSDGNSNRKVRGENTR